MPVCVSENNALSQIVESAGGCSGAHARVAGTEVDVENGGSDSKSERGGSSRLGVDSRCFTSGSSKFFTLRREGDCEQKPRDAGCTRHDSDRRSGYMNV